MTDRIHALTVALDKDIRDDDVQALAAAIGQLRHVVGVTTEKVDVSDYSARARVNMEWHTRLLDMLRALP